jgi:hypothetical protein
LLQPLLLGSCAAVVMLYSGLAILERKWTLVVMQAFFLSLIVLQIYQFSALASVTPNANAGFQYVFGATFIVFSTIIADGFGVKLTQSMFQYAFGYTVVYFLISVLFDLGLFPQDILRSMTMDDTERGKRLYIYPGASSFAWFCCLHVFWRRPGLLSFAGLLVCGAAIYLSLSRVFIVFVCLLSAFYILRTKPSSIRAVCLAVMWGVSLATFGGLIWQQWNPFVFFSGDSSGSFRADEYDTARAFILENPILGVGMAPTQQDMGQLTGNPYFSANDLGAFGVWFDWGLPGLLVFFLASHIICQFPRRVAPGFRLPLFLTGSLLAGYGCIAPTILYSAGATYLAVILGYWLRPPGRARPRPLPTDAP